MEKLYVVLYRLQYDLKESDGMSQGTALDDSPALTLKIRLLKSRIENSNILFSTHKTIGKFTLADRIRRLKYPVYRLSYSTESSRLIYKPTRLLLATTSLLFIRFANRVAC
jgi:hypothetical protein